jgi:hypothetical protein
MLTDTENQRMELAKSTDVKTNCIGTVLYVLGVSDDDTYIGAGEKRWEDGIVDGLLKRMTKVDKPQEGAVLVISGWRVEHMGIVVQEDPPKVYHRPGINNPIQSNAPLEEVISSYNHHPTKEFYIR